MDTVSEINKKQLGQRLRLARENKGWSQVYVAKLLNGITSQALSNYERGERDPDTVLLKQLAQLYEVSVDWLLGRTNNPKSIGSNNGSTPTPEQRIAEALADDPELLEFFQELIKRDDLFVSISPCTGSSK